MFVLCFSTLITIFTVELGTCNYHDGFLHCRGEDDIIIYAKMKRRCRRLYEETNLMIIVVITNTAATHHNIGSMQVLEMSVDSFSGKNVHLNSLGSPLSV